MREKEEEEEGRMWRWNNGGKKNNMKEKGI